MRFVLLYTGQPRERSPGKKGKMKGKRNLRATACPDSEPASTLTSPLNQFLPSTLNSVVLQNASLNTSDREKARDEPAEIFRPFTSDPPAIWAGRSEATWVKSWSVCHEYLALEKTKSMASRL